MFKLYLKKGRGTKDKTANIYWIIEKAREFQKSIYFCFIVYIKAFDCVDHNKQWKVLKEMWIPDHLTCLLRNLCAGQEATFRTGHGTISSVQFSHSVMSDSLWPHELQHARPPCPSLTPGVHPHPCPSSWWYHPTLLSSVVPFSHLQSFPASGSFQMSQLFTSGGQSIGVSASTSVLPMNTQDWSPLGWTGWIFLQSKGLTRVFSNTTVQKHQFFGAQLSSQSNSHIHTRPLEKP